MIIKNLLLSAVSLLVFAATTKAQIPNYVPSNGLVGWWPFNGNANDESGNGNNGMVNGATLTSDRNGISNKAFNFNHNSINLLNNPQAHFSGSWSISLWYKRSGYSTGYLNYGALFTTSSQIQYNGVGIWLIMNEFKMFFQTYGQNALILEPYAYDMNWHHVVYTFNGSTISFYIDSVLITSGPITISQTHTSPFNIGRGFDAFGNDFSFMGDLDDYGIWNRALTQQEITDLYNAVNCANNTTITSPSNSLNTGSTATLNATTSDPNPSYVWQSDLGQGFQTLNNFGNYSGVNTATLNISNVQLSNHNQPIRVITTSGNCIDTSNISTITIADTCITTITETTLITVTDTLVINTFLTGLNPPNNINTIRIFPNPTNDHITIHYGNFALMNGYQLKIENSIGQQVFQNNITQQMNYMDLTTWGGNGIYFVHIINPQGNTVDTRKIVLQ
jgi:hypothetical protein